MKINVKVITTAHKNIVKKLDNGNYVVRIVTAPEKGKANKKVQELLAIHFKVAKNAVDIIKGITSKNKIIYINK